MGHRNGINEYILSKPFVPIEDNFHKYFLPNKYAFILPSFIIILVTTSVMGYLGYILINSEHYRKPTIKPWEDYKNI